MPGQQGFDKNSGERHSMGGQTYNAAVDMVDRADVHAVGADHFHVLFDCVCVSHW